MKHDKLTDAQIAEFGLMTEGVKDFTVLKATEKQSAAGNDMFELQLTVYDEKGNPRPVRDWVMPSFPKKFKHIHDALGILDIYEKGETKPSDLEGRSGKLNLKIGEPKINNQGLKVRYNEVEDYVKKDPSAASTTPPKKAVEAISSDEIPF